MLRFCSILVVAAVAVVAAPGPGGASAPVVPGTLMIKFSAADDGAAKEAVLAALAPHGGDVLTSCWLPEYDGCVAALRAGGRTLAPAADACVTSLKQLYAASFDAGVDPAKLAAALARLPGVDYAEPRLVRRTLAIPDDPQFGNLGQDHFAFHNFPAGWDVSQGSADVVIAIVDSGVNYAHPDLAANAWTNPGEIPDNGIDDDGNGYIDDFFGWDFWASGSLFDAGQDNDPMEDASDHGTHVAGIAAAVTDNGIGVAGAGWNCRFMAVKAGGVQSSEDAIGFGFDGILYAAVNGAQVINCSWGGLARLQHEEEMVETAVALGAVIIAAAGNEASEAFLYPAAYPDVLSVGNVSRPTNRRYSTSNFGYWIDVMASGVSIKSTESNDGYGFKTGTSMSSPIVAGVAGLLRAHQPAWPASRVRAQLRGTAVSVDAENEPSMAHKSGNGRLDAQRALTLAIPGFRVVTAALEDAGGDRLVPGSSGFLRLNVVNDNAPSVNAMFSVESLTAGLVVPAGGVNVGTVATDAPATIDIPVQLLDDVDLAQTIEFIVTMTDSAVGYSDFVKIDISDLAIATFAVNRVETTMTSAGSIGYLDGLTGVGGVGFVPRQGEENSPGSVLFEGGLIIDADGIIVDRVRQSGTLSADFAPRTPFDVQIPGTVSAADGIGSFDSSAKPAAPPFDVTLESFAFDQPDVDQVVFLKYTIHNPSAAPLYNCFSGLFTDWDIGPNAFADSVAFSAGDSVMYAGVSNDPTLPSVAVVPMGALYSLFAVDNSHDGAEDPLNFGIYHDGDTNANGFTDEEKSWALHARFDKTAIALADISTVCTSGPYTVPADGTVVAGFIIAYGDSVADLQTQVAAARALNVFAVSDADTLQPQNQRPVIAANRPTADFVVLPSATARLALDFSVTDDNRPVPDGLSMAWTTVSGPAAVVFDTGTTPATATFPAPGIYEIVLTADDGLLTAVHGLTVAVDHAAVLTDQLLAHWPMDDTGATATDASGSGRTATLSDIVANAGGMVAGALEFNGTTSLADFAAPATTQVSMSGWARASGAGSDVFSRIFDMPGYLLYWGRDDLGEPFRDDTLLFYAEHSIAAGTWHTPPDSVTDNQWFHIAVTYDSSDTGNDPQLYINGAAATVTPIDMPEGTPLDNDGTGYIGNREPLDRAWFGLLDDWRLHGRLLSPTEVLALYRAATADTGPVVTVGADQVVQLPAIITLNGAVVDNNASATWSQVSGPGIAQFADANSAVTTVSLSLPGTYVLRLTADDGITASFEDVAVTAQHNISFAVSPANMTIAEGESGSFTVALANAPLDTVAVTVVPDAGDSRLTLTSTANLVFSPADWSTPQTVALDVAEDDGDVSDNQWQLRLHQTAGLDNLEDSLITVTEIDDDIRLTITRSGAGSAPPTGTVVFDPAELPLIVSAAPNPGARLANWTLTADGPIGEGDRVEIVRYGELEAGIVATVDATLDVRFTDASVTLVLQFDNAQVVEVRFGLHAQATDAFDDGIDLAAPDDSGAGLAAVRLLSPDTARAEQPLVHDFRGFGRPARFHLLVDVPAGAPVARMSWNFTALDDFHEIFLQRQIDERPVGAPVDMKAVQQLDIEATGDFEIVYAVPAQHTVALSAGWNLVSLPIIPRTDLQQVDVANAVWRWDATVQRYVEEEFVNAETGYWIHADTAGTAALSGVVANGLVELPGGWHLLGPAAERPHGLAAHAWYWDAAAQRLRRQNPDQSLLPGRAYWVWSPLSATVDLGAE